MRSVERGERQRSSSRDQTFWGPNKFGRECDGVSGTPVGGPGRREASSYASAEYAALVAASCALLCLFLLFPVQLAAQGRCCLGVNMAAAGAWDSSCRGSFAKLPTVLSISIVAGNPPPPPVSLDAADPGNSPAMANAQSACAIQCCRPGPQRPRRRGGKGIARTWQSSASRMGGSVGPGINMPGPYHGPMRRTVSEYGRSCMVAHNN